MLNDLHIFINGHIKDVQEWREGLNPNRKQQETAIENHKKFEKFGLYYKSIADNTDKQKLEKLSRKIVNIFSEK